MLNLSQDSKFAPDVSGSSPPLPDSSSSHHGPRLHEISRFHVKPQNGKEEEEDSMIPISFEDPVLPLHSSRKEILGYVPIQKNNHIPINNTKFALADQPSLGADHETRSYIDSAQAVVYKKHGYLVPEKGVTQANRETFAPVQGSNGEAVSPKVRTAAPKNGKAVNSVMISKSNVPNMTFPEKATSKMEKAPNRKMAQIPESEPIEANIDDRFSHYISRAKLKIRMMSNAGGGKTGVDKDTVNDRFTDYINHAKMKLRRTFSVSEGKNFPKNEKP